MKRDTTTAYFWTQHPSAKTWAHNYVKAQLDTCVQDIIARASSQVAQLMTADTLDNPVERLPQAMKYIKTVIQECLDTVQEELMTDINNS